MARPQLHNIHQGPGLEQEARLLRDSPLFVGTTDDFPLSHKQAIFLVLAGCKPVAEVASGHWESTLDGRRTVADNPDEVATLLQALELSFSLRSDENVTDAVVSRTPDFINEFEAAPDARAVGLLFGYPPSAVDAYDHDQLLSEAEQRAVDDAAGLVGVGFFRYSRDHWQDEQAVARQWFHEIRAYGLC